MVWEVTRKDNFQLRATLGEIHCLDPKLSTTELRKQLSKNHPSERQRVHEGIPRAVRRGRFVMPHGLPREYPISHSGGALTKSVPPQNLKENAKDLCRIEDQGFFPMPQKMNTSTERKTNHAGRKRMVKKKGTVCGQGSTTEKRPTRGESGSQLGPKAIHQPVHQFYFA